jgi:hypothetical protein
MAKFDVIIKSFPIRYSPFMKVLFGRETKFFEKKWFFGKNERLYLFKKYG